MSALTIDHDKMRRLKHEILTLKHQLFKKVAELREMTEIAASPDSNRLLTNDEIARYSRQIILPQIGVEGQLKLKNASVLIVGAGGLGCPAIMYLIAAGIGTIGIIDYDLVEKNNLHRQILHHEGTIGISKVVSAQLNASKLNSNVAINSYEFILTNENALDLVKEYDVILDCTDNVATRYLLNDACVLTGKPLVSGSALRLEGQLTVYNYQDGPCYRCVFPSPPPPETVTNCGDGGVLGAVTGVIGSLQALEAIKIATNMDGVLSGRLLIFDAAQTVFRNIRVRTKRINCDICSEKPIITRLLNYEQFCGMQASDKDFSLNILEDDDRISVHGYKNLFENNPDVFLIDVRSPIEYKICHLENSVNIPLKDILEDTKLDEIKSKVNKNSHVFCLCRRGNDSQWAVQHLSEKLKGITTVKDIKGGLHAWHLKIDSTFPLY